MTGAVSEAINPADAALGLVQILQSASQFGGSGFQVSAAVASYPAELLNFLPDVNFQSRDVLKFEANGIIWNNYCAVAMHGFFSDTSADLVCLPSISSTVPSNRYVKSLGFSEG